MMRNWVCSTFVFISFILQTKFMGASGHVRFNSLGQRTDVELDIFQTTDAPNSVDAVPSVVGSWSTARGLMWTQGRNSTN